MSSDRLASMIALLGVLFLAVNGLSHHNLPRGTAMRMALLWFGLFGLVVLIFWIITHYRIMHLT